MATRVEAPRGDGAVEVRLAGAVRRELRCAGCGYGVSVAGEPPPCPMCRGAVWDPAPWRPFTGLAAIADLDAGSDAQRPR